MLDEVKVFGDFYKNCVLCSESWFFKKMNLLCQCLMN